MVTGLLKRLEGAGSTGTGTVFTKFLSVRCIPSRYSRNANHNPTTYTESTAFTGQYLVIVSLHGLGYGFWLITCFITFVIMITPKVNIIFLTLWIKKARKDDLPKAIKLIKRGQDLNVGL